MTKEIPEVRLRRIEEEDFELMERWMAVDDVFAFIDYEEPPSRYELKVEILAGRVDVLIIELGDSTPVGFFFVFTRGVKRTNIREFDVAIAEEAHRSIGVAQGAIRAFEDWAFEDQQLSGVWANIFPENEPCLSLVRACGWPISEVDEGGITFRGQPADVVYTKMTPEMREEARAKRGF